MYPTNFNLFSISEYFCFYQTKKLLICFTFLKEFVNTQVAAYENVTPTIFIGLNDLQVEGDFQWTDGLPVEPTLLYVFLVIHICT